MSHTPHSLLHDFAEYTALIHFLSVNDRHFKRLCDRYEQLNYGVIRAESGMEPVTDAQLSEMRFERVRLKDKISAALLRRGAKTTTH